MTHYVYIFLSKFLWYFQEFKAIFERQDVLLCDALILVERRENLSLYNINMEPFRDLERGNFRLREMSAGPQNAIFFPEPLLLDRLTHLNFLAKINRRKWISQTIGQQSLGWIQAIPSEAIPLKSDRPIFYSATKDNFWGPHFISFPFPHDALVALLLSWGCTPLAYYVNARFAVFWHLSTSSHRFVT